MIHWSMIKTWVAGQIPKFATGWISGLAEEQLTELLKRLINDVESVDAKLDRIIDAPFKTGITYLKSANMYPNKSRQQLRELNESKRYFVEATSQSIGLKKAQSHYFTGRISEVLKDFPSRNFHYDKTLEVLNEHRQQLDSLVIENESTSEDGLFGIFLGVLVSGAFPPIGLGFAAINGGRIIHTNLFGSGKGAGKMQTQLQELDQTMINTLTLYENGDLQNQTAPEKNNLFYGVRNFISTLKNSKIHKSY